MEEEKKFEKKSNVKLSKVIIAVILLIVLAILGVVYINTLKTPKRIFKKAVTEVFNMVETPQEEIKSQRLELELSASIDSNDLQMMAINPMIKAINIKSITEMDLNKKILNQNFSLNYDNMQIVGLDAILQEERVFVFLEDFYSKYIELTDEIKSELGTAYDVSTIFENNTTPIDKELLKDIKQLLVDEIESRELVQEKVELDGKTVTKSTIRLTPKEVAQITVNVLKKVNESQNSAELQDMIVGLEEEIQYMYETENYLDISIYTKGLVSKFDRCIFKFVNKEDNQTIKFIVQEDEDETIITGEIDNEELIKIRINEKNENEGTMSITVNIAQAMSEQALYEEEIDASVTLKIKYKVENNIEIEQTNTKNSIKLNDMTEADYDEIYENIENNEILYSIFGSALEY